MADLFAYVCSISPISVADIWTFATCVKETILVQPLRRLYFQGPDFKSFGMLSVGFWNGVSKSEICAHLTTIQQQHWLEHGDLCEKRIERQFLAFVVMVEFVMYMFAAISLMRHILARYFPDELTKEIRSLRKWCQEDSKHPK